MSVAKNPSKRLKFLCSTSCSGQEQERELLGHYENDTHTLTHQHTTDQIIIVEKKKKQTDYDAPHLDASTSTSDQIIIVAESSKKNKRTSNNKSSSPSRNDE